MCNKLQISLCQLFLVKTILLHSMFTVKVGLYCAYQKITKNIIVGNIKRKNNNCDNKYESNCLQSLIDICCLRSLL